MDLFSPLANSPGDYYIRIFSSAGSQIWANWYSTTDPGFLGIVTTDADDIGAITIQQFPIHPSAGGELIDNVTFYAVLGDANNDGEFNNLDIVSFVLALTNLPAYQSMFPGVNPDSQLDMNGDEVFNNLDIAGFVAALTGR